jgi:hypothetical protein
MPRALLRLSLLLLLWPGTAAFAADLGIAAFQGVWRGNAVSESEISANFQLTSRDIDVTVRTDTGGGFAIVWNTVQRQKGDPNNPREELKSTEMQFTPARPGVWRAAANGDPLDSAAPFAWAFVKDRTLHIVRLQIYADGRHETQIYRRTLSGTGMTLEFVRNVDGEQVRWVSGRLIKVAN